MVGRGVVVCVRRVCGGRGSGDRVCVWWEGVTGCVHTLWEGGVVTGCAVGGRGSGDRVCVRRVCGGRPRGRGVVC